MPTVSVALTTAFKEIVADQTLTTDTRYNVQNVGSEYITAIESASAPSATDTGHVIEPYHFLPVTPDGINGLYFRTIAGTGLIAITEDE